MSEERGFYLTFTKGPGRRGWGKIRAPAGAFVGWKMWLHPPVQTRAGQRGSWQLSLFSCRTADSGPPWERVWSVLFRALCHSAGSCLCLLPPVTSMVTDEDEAQILSLFYSYFWHLQKYLLSS